MLRLIQGPRRRPFLFLVAAMFFPTVFVKFVAGFAGNLVDTESGCMVDLDTTEVIMNHQVVPFEESTHPELYLAAQMPDGSWSPGPILINDQIQFFVKLLSSSDQKLGDVQYVVETSEGAQFVDGGCENKKRTSSKMRNDPGVVIEFHDPTKAPIRVWAGWATGHEAVQLTKELLFVTTPPPKMEKPEIDGSKAEKEGVVEEIRNLVDTESGCLVNLDTTEVIMDHQVVPYEESTHPELYLAAQMPDGSWSPGPILINDQIQFFVKLLSSSDKELGDVQYVVETSQGAQFVDGGCENKKRTSSKMRNDPGVVIEFHDPTKAPIRVWAGWATGHEAVQLTKELLFVTTPPPKPEIEPLEAVMEEIKEEVEQQEGAKQANELFEAEKAALKDLGRLKLLQEEAHKKTQHNVKDVLSQAHVDVAKKVKELNIQKIAGSHKDLLHRHNKTTAQDTLHSGRFKDAKHRQHIEHESLKNMNRHAELLKNSYKEKLKKREEADLTAYQAFRRKYERVNGEVDLRHYTYGVIVFIVGMVVVVQGWLMAGKRDKGQHLL